MKPIEHLESSRIYRVGHIGSLQRAVLEQVRDFAMCEEEPDERELLALNSVLGGSKYMSSVETQNLIAVIVDWSNGLDDDWHNAETSEERSEVRRLQDAASRLVLRWSREVG